MRIVQETLNLENLGREREKERDREREREREREGEGERTRVFIYMRVRAGAFGRARLFLSRIIGWVFSLRFSPAIYLSHEQTTQSRIVIVIVKQTRDAKEIAARDSRFSRDDRLGGRLATTERGIGRLRDPIFLIPGKA